jgi:hypothetical protein
MTDKDAMKLALDALETEVSIDWTNNDEFNASAEKMHEAITALKERLAQPEQEPVAWFTQARNFVPLDEFPKEEAKLYGWNELYLRPPQRTWVGLTDEDIGDAYVAWDDADGASFADFARAIEAKLKEKNNG